MIPHLFSKILNCCNISIDCCLPNQYEPQPGKGTLLEEILDLKDNYANFGISDEELYHLNKRYEKIKGKKNLNNTNLLFRFLNMFNSANNDKKDNLNNGESNNTESNNNNSNNPEFNNDISNNYDKNYNEIILDVSSLIILLNHYHLLNQKLDLHLNLIETLVLLV